MPGSGPAACLGAPVYCVVLAARCCGSSPLCREGRRESPPQTLPPASLTVPEEGLSFGSESACLLWNGIYKLEPCLVTVVYESTDPEVRYRVRKKPQICRAVEG